MICVNFEFRGLCCRLFLASEEQVLKQSVSLVGRKKINLKKVILVFEDILN